MIPCLSLCAVYDPVSVTMSGGIYDYVDKILQACLEQGVQVVFALSRRRLATILHKKQKIGSVGIFYYDGAEVRDRHTGTFLTQTRWWCPSAADLHDNSLTRFRLISRR